MSAERAVHRTLRIGAAVAAAAIGLLLAVGAAVFVKRGTDVFTRGGYPQAAATLLGAVEVAAGLLFAVPRTRAAGGAALMGVLGWAAGFHFALGKPAGSFFLWMAAIAAISLVGHGAARRVRE